jgi:hypothetical protein
MIRPANAAASPGCSSPLATAGRQLQTIPIRRQRILGHHFKTHPYSARGDAQNRFENQ